MSEPSLTSTEQAHRQEATTDKDRKRVLSDRRRVLLIAGYLACDGDLIDEDPNS